MSEMVEQVARALYDLECQRIAADPTAPYRGPFAPFEELLKAKAHYIEQAQVAIKATRELPGDPGPRYTDGEYSRRTQAAMVDDALGLPR